MVVKKPFSSIIHFYSDYTRKTWNTDFIIICHKLWINMKIACEPFAYLKFYIFSWRIAFTWSGSFSESFRILCRRVYGRLVRVVQSVNNRYILLLMHDFNSMGQVLHEWSKIANGTLVRLISYQMFWKHKMVESGIITSFSS